MGCAGGVEYNSEEDMKHAFMIIAHNEFTILQRLISALDDERIDIYVHIDKKVREMPVLHANHAGLFILQNRVDVRWGHVSQIECEYALFREAYKPGEYCFYHLISGVHYPIKSIDDVLVYYEQNVGKVVFDGMGKDAFWQERAKIRNYNFFMKWYASGMFLSRLFSQLFRRISCFLQKVFKIWRYRGIAFFKASNWASFPEEALSFLLSNEMVVLKRYRMTFCGDEFFAPTELMNSEFHDRIVNGTSILYQVFGEASPRILICDDFDAIQQSGCLFGRKFSSSNMDILNKIDEYAHRR